MKELLIGCNAAITLLTILIASFNLTQSLVPPSKINSQYFVKHPLPSFKRTKSVSRSSDSDDNVTRRDSIRTAVSFLCTSSLAFNSATALAIDDTPAPTSGGKTPKKEVAEFTSKRNKFSVTVPSTFKIITNKTGSDTPVSGQIFSALDLNSGTVVTVHRENACLVDRYVSSPKTCDFVRPADGVLLSEETLERDATKILIRHDDRDNAVLGGTSTLESVKRAEGDSGGIVVVANTILPTGGTYTDGMGLEQKSTFTRVVKARVVVQTEEDGVSQSYLGVWVSSPLDEWQKPVMGTRLRQIVESVSIDGGKL